MMVKVTGGVGGRIDTPFLIFQTLPRRTQFMEFLTQFLVYAIELQKRVL